MNLVLLIPASRRRCNAVILAILLLWPMCSLAQVKRAAGADDQNDPAFSGMHGSSIFPAAKPTRLEDRHVGIASRPENDRAGRVNPVSSQVQYGWRLNLSGSLYLSPERGYHVSPTLLRRFASRFEAGAGTALDFYTIRTVPVFGHFAADITRRRVATPFVYADPGLTFPWPRPREYPGWRKPDQKLPGVYLNVGVGQRLRLGPGPESVALSCGYSLETFRLRYKEVITGVNPERLPEPLWETYRYVFNRLVLKLSMTL